jgi:hypothetical protein
MKRFLYIPILLLSTWIAPGKASAQVRADWMPEEGFWQVVSTANTKQPNDKQPNDKQSNDRPTVLVQFFGFHEQLIYEERLDARDVNPHKRRTRLLLNECLRAALSASAKNKEVLMDQGWVSARMKQQK